MKYLHLLLSMLMILALASCGGVSKYAADYDDIYYSNRKNNKVVSKNAENKAVKKNEEVVLTPYSRSKSGELVYVNKDGYAPNDSLAGELDDQVVYINNEDNVYDVPYTSSNVYQYLQDKKAAEYETNYEDRINRFSNNNATFYSNFSYQNWNNSFYPMFGFMFGNSAYRNPYTHFGYFNPYYSRFDNPFYLYNQPVYNPYYYSDPYWGYNSYRYNPYSYYYGGYSGYYGNYYGKKTVQRTRRQRTYANSAKGNAARYNSYSRNAKPANYKRASYVGNKRNTAYQSPSNKKTTSYKYANKPGHRRNTNSYVKRAKRTTSTPANYSTPSTSRNTTTSSYSGVGTSRSSSSYSRSSTRSSTRSSSNRSSNRGRRR